jgi:tetratricopeptide (TPR) repeat protein
MSFLKKLFGGTFEDHFAEGKRLFANQSFGPAKLSLDRAISKAKDANSAAAKEARALLSQCRRLLAEAKLVQADEAAASGDMEGAIALLQDAEEICEEDAVVEAVRERFKSFEAMDTRRLVEEVGRVDDDELLTIIAGTWTDDQADEYAALPEELRGALLADHDGRHEAAAEAFEQIIARADLKVAPRYLYFEAGKSLLGCKRYDDAVEMLDRFFAATKDDAASLETRLWAHDMKAAAFSATKRFDEAEKELLKATETAPENHTVFLNLGVYLRRLEKFEQSVRVLERSRELMGQMHPDFAVIRELGFTYLAMGKKDEAADCLGAVIEHQASRGEHSQFDPATAGALAALYEEKRDFQKAADLFRHLAVGFDTENYFIYNMQAARLLQLAKADRALVESYLARAREIAETDEETASLEALESAQPE